VDVDEHVMAKVVHVIAVAPAAAQELHERGLQWQDLADEPLVDVRRAHGRIAKMRSPGFARVRCIAHSPASLQPGLMLRSHQIIRTSEASLCGPGAQCYFTRTQKGRRIAPPPFGRDALGFAPTSFWSGVCQTGAGP